MLLNVFYYGSQFFLCLTEKRNSYRSGTTWGQVNDDRLNIFGVNYPFKTMAKRITVRW